MKRLFLILLLLFCAVATWAAILIDGTPDAFTEAAADTVHTSASLTIANNTNRLLIVPFSTNANVTAISSNFNGGALTERTASNSTGMEMHLWFRIAPDVATSIVTINLGASQRLIQIPISLYNVDQTTPIRDSKVESGTTQTITANLSVTSAIGDWVGSCMAVLRAGGLDPGTLIPNDGTELEELNNTLGTRFSCSHRVAVSTTTIVGWDWAGPNDNWAHVAFSVAPSSVGNPVMYYTNMRNQ